MADISHLVEMLEEEKQYYYVLRGRELYTEDNIEIIQNDMEGTLINILVPSRFENFDLTDPSTKIYIDYIDGKGRPGVVSNQILIEGIYDKDFNPVDPGIDPGTEHPASFGKEWLDFSVDNKIVLTETKTLGQCTLEPGTYYIESNIKPDLITKNYQSNVVHENLDEYIKISKDFGDKYNEVIYYIKTNQNLQLKTLEIGDNTYNYIEWKIDQNITNAKGTVSFSLRLEKNVESVSYKIQSKISNFNIIENLKEEFFLKKEIEENYVIQGREIKPIGNFKNILVKGDTNSNKIFYKMNRYFQGQDMLLKKQFDDKDVYVFDNGVFGAKNNNEYYALNVIYEINDLSIYNINQIGSYNNGVIQIGDNTYSINEFRKEYWRGDNTYRFCLSLSGQSPIYMNSLNDKIILDGNEYNIIIDGYGIGFDYSFRSDGQHQTITGNMVPVYNRTIRAVFLSPDGTYGDWNDCELEYINEDEEYFIFSWTPDYRATRAAGELSYYIEFYITDIVQETDESGNIIKTKAYSWSTLPSTITIEDNRVGTASREYIPHWVSYIENQYQNDFDIFMNNEIRSDYEELVDYFSYALLGTENIGQEADYSNNSLSVTLNDIQYTITFSESTVDGEFVGYDIDLFAALADGNLTIYTYKGNTQLTASNSNLYTGILNIEKSKEASTEKETISTYFVIYNPTITNENGVGRLTFYNMILNDNINTPFISVLNDTLQSFQDQFEASQNARQTDYDTLRSTILTSFGLDSTGSISETDEGLAQDINNTLTQEIALLTAEYSASAPIIPKLNQETTTAVSIDYNNRQIVINDTNYPFYISFENNIPYINVKIGDIVQTAQLYTLETPSNPQTILINNVAYWFYLKTIDNLLLESLSTYEDSVNNTLYGDGTETNPGIVREAIDDAAAEIIVKEEDSINNIEAEATDFKNEIIETLVDFTENYNSFINDLNSTYEIYSEQIAEQSTGYSINIDDTGTILIIQSNK